LANSKGFWKKAALFLVKFFLIYAVLQYIILNAPLGLLENWIASIQAALLGLKAEGNIVLFNVSRFEIAANCTGLMSIAVLAAIVFSLRKPEMKKKIALLALGFLVLFPLNLLRVYLVLLVAISLGPGSAEALHVATWFAMSAAILFLWYYLTKRLAKVEEFAAIL